MQRKGLYDDQTKSIAIKIFEETKVVLKRGPKPNFVTKCSHFERTHGEKSRCGSFYGLDWKSKNIITECTHV